MIKEPDVEIDEDEEAYIDVMARMGHELLHIWEYMQDKYEVPSDFLITAFLDTAFDQAILDCGSAMGAVVGFQHAVGELAEDSMAREMRIFKMRVN